MPLSSPRLSTFKLASLSKVICTAAISFFILLATSFYNEQSVLASENFVSTRNLLLPTRWHAQYLKEPIFNSNVYMVNAGRENTPTVLLVHGLGQSGYQDWWEVIHALEGSYNVFALDLPGFGRSNTSNGELSPARYAGVLDWVITKLDLRDINLVGHSYGAAVVLYYAGTYSERIKNVVVADVAGILQRNAFVNEIAVGQLDDQSSSWFLSDQVKHLFDISAQVVERFMISSEFDAIQLLRNSGTSWSTLLNDRPSLNAAISLLETDFSGVLSDFKLPTTIIWGEVDRVTPIRTGHLLDGHLSNSALQIIEGAGHAPMRSHSNRFIKHLHQALTNPPIASIESIQNTGITQNFNCVGQRGQLISGNFNKIVLDHCPDARLVDVKANHIRIYQSARAQLRHVVINSEGAGLNIESSNVTATNLHVTGNPAIDIDSGRLDLAGGILISPGAALRIKRRSTIILSVSQIESSFHRGLAHGAVLASDSIGDQLSDLLSN